MTPAEALAAAMRHHQAGQLAEAERLYRQVLAAEPGHLQALTLSGALAHMAGRNGDAADLFGRALAVSEQPDLHYNSGLAKWALGRRAEAATHWSRAIALNPNFAPAHMNLGNALREEGDLDQAVTHLRQALQLQPSPFAHNNLGLALAARGDPQGAMHYRRAIEMHPGFVEPHLNLALELVKKGDVAQALAWARRALQIKETSDTTALFARVVGALEAVGDDPGLRQLVTRAALEGWGRAGDLAAVATTLIKHGSALEARIARAEPAWPEAAKEPLLAWLLESTVICDLELERFLTATRAGLLEATETAPDAVDDTQLRFACALARQCFSNEYVYAATEQEGERVQRLRGLQRSPLRLAVIGAYEPLHFMPDGDALLAQSWPTPVDALLTQQIREPRDEALVRASIPRLTPIEDDVSRLVQAQYEQNPYPRWVAAGQPPRYESFDALMQREHPRAPFRRTGKADLDILIAGCGTGQHSIDVARQFERSRVLAVDLSTASLAYATTRARALGIANVEHAQVDILQLGAIGRTFDMIQAGGVLHHLRDPWAGWQILLSLLRPNGAMYVALYSALGRRDIVAAREFIAQRGYGSTPADIRACRQALTAQADGGLRNVALFNDFFTTSECRDLLFHVQEHRMRLPEIRRFLAASGLTFLGFEANARARQQYAARFPQDEAMIDLDNWDAFEQDNPYTFASMYRFWVQKSD
jgi:tetratricopeptide (TPR) repeat protein/SAM-dependent methyltransferase